MHMEMIEKTVSIKSVFILMTTSFDCFDVMTF